MLDAAIEAAVDQWSMETWMSQEQADREAFAKRDPSTLVVWGEKEKAELRKVAQEVWSNWAKKSPLAQKSYDSQVAFLKKLGKL